MSDPRGHLRPLVALFLENLLVKGKSEETAKTYQGRLLEFLAWCDDRELVHAQDVTRQHLERYQRQLFHRTATTGKNKGERLSAKSQHGHLSALKSFFRFLVRQELISANPAADLEMPSIKDTLPKDVLTVLEAEAILSRPDLSTPLGVRDRAILELLFATGIRRSELCALSIYDLDAARRTLHIKKGKGGKERIVPTGERALFFVEDYLRRARPALASGSSMALFLTNKGAGILEGTLSRRVATYVQEASVGKEGSCHLFRHTMATLMLEGGADVRFIQAMLGHRDLGTTEVYTHVSIDALKEVHLRTHPAAKLSRGMVES